MSFGPSVHHTKNYNLPTPAGPRNKILDVRPLQFSYCNSHRSEVTVFKKLDNPYMVIIHKKKPLSQTQDPHGSFKVS